MAAHHGICHLCGQPGADTVDHMVRGDDHSMDNLAPVHDRAWPHCHRAKTSHEANTQRWSVRATRQPEAHPGIR